MIVNTCFYDHKSAKAVVTPNGKRVTFYYDNKDHSSEGTVYEITNGAQHQWATSSLEIAVFDITFSAYDKLTTLNAWFYNCTRLSAVEGLNFLNTSNVTLMNNMFATCTSLKTLDVSGFNTSKVTNMRYMFASCSSLTSLDVRGFTTSAVTDFSYMFYYCLDLSTLDVSCFNTSNAVNMEAMFGKCTSLTTIDVRGFNTLNVSNLGYIFWKCNTLQTILASNNFVVGQSAIDENMFTDSTMLIGGSGTPYSSSHVDGEYARIDNPPDAPGYFTAAS